MTSEGIGLINRVIKFHLAQRMWSGITNVTDRQTDRRTDVIRWHDRSIAIAWSGKNVRLVKTYANYAIRTGLTRATAKHLNLWVSARVSIGIRWNIRASQSLKQEAQLPLREHGVSFVLSFHHNATLGNLAFLGVYLYTLRYVWDVF